MVTSKGRKKQPMIFNVITVIIYTLYSISVFSFAKSLHLILEISATYRLVSYLVHGRYY